MRIAFTSSFPPRYPSYLRTIVLEEERHFLWQVFGLNVIHDGRCGTALALTVLVSKPFSDREDSAVGLDPDCFTLRADRFFEVYIHRTPAFNQYTLAMLSDHSHIANSYRGFLRPTKYIWLLTFWLS